jgi:molybdopterin/thiamine biosynthesis adenylyltransferase
LRLIWDADIFAAGLTFPISLRYPNHFPHSPPLVLPRGVEERWSSHQYGAGGELCLEYGPDNWHPDITGADMILSAHRLLQGERPATEVRGIVASRHRTTIGQDLRGKTTRFMLTPALMECSRLIPDGAMLSADVICTFHKETLACVVSSVTMLEGEKWADPSFPNPLLFEGYKLPAALFRWPAIAPLPSTESRTSFQTSVVERGLVLPAVRYALLVQESRIRAYFLSEDDDTVNEVSVIHPETAVARLDESHAMLAARKVGIVGCGSIGSKLAIMLARSGTGKFLLVDDDILYPENFVRHDLDWRDVATHKVHSVARRIQLVNPSATCEKREHRLGGQEASGNIESLMESLADCDLIVDTTADASVFNYLCAVVAFAKKPLLWAEIFGGGFGGLIARHRPLLDPDPASMRRAIENWCSEQGKPIVRAAIDYGGGFGVPLIADDADVTTIASHAARMGIDMLIPRNPSIFPNSVYIIGLAQGWIFERPFETYPIEMGSPALSDVQVAIDPQEAAAELKRILQLFEANQDATSSSAADSRTPSP